MSDFAIICEFNPLHGGHQYLIDEARRLGADRVVCVMSGGAVQRGSLAVTDPYLRAECAIRAGADLVVELPFPWSSASAEQFARAGVCIASRLADTLIFGSECGDLALLEKGATLASEENFRTAYGESLASGAPAAGAYYGMLEDALGKKLSSNDILGVEYLRAIQAEGGAMRAMTVKREGAAYGADTLREGEFPSATGIRRLWESGHFEEADAFLPEECREVFRRARNEGRLVKEEKLESLILGWFRLHTGEDFSEIAGAGGGLFHRFCAVASEVTSLSEFYEGIRTKRYTDAHLRRAVLYGLTGVKEGEFSSLPQYTTLLAANERGRALLSEYRRGGDLPVITKPSDAPADTVQYQRGEKLGRLLALATDRTETGGFLLKKTPFIL